MCDAGNVHGVQLHYLFIVFAYFIVSVFEASFQHDGVKKNITHRFSTVNNKHTPLQNGLQPFVLILRCDASAFGFSPTRVKLPALHAYICVSWLMCLFAGAQENMSKLFFSFLPLQERNHILAPSQ